MRRSRAVVVGGLVLALLGAGAAVVLLQTDRRAVPEPAVYGELDPEVAALIRHLVGNVREQPGDVMNWVRLGMGYQANQEPVLAARTFVAATELAPHDSPAWFGLAKVRAAQGEMDAAERAMRRAIELEPDYAPAHWRLGFWLFEQGKFDNAAQHLQRATHLDEKDPSAWFGMARVLLARGDVEDAITRLEWLSERPPPYGPYAWQLLSSAYRRLGRFEDAETARLRGHGAEPSFRDPWDIEVTKLERGFGSQLQRAKSLLAFRRADDSIALLKKLQRRRPDDPMVLNNLATAYRAVGRFDESRRVLEEALEMQPSFVHAHFGLALTAWSQSNDEASAREALSHLETTLELNASYAPAHALRGEILAFLGRHEDAANALEQAYHLHPGNARWLHQAAQSKSAAERWREAAEMLDTVTRQAPGLAEAWSDYSIALTKLGREQESQAALDRAVQLAPTAEHTAKAQRVIRNEPEPKAVGP